MINLKRARVSSSDILSVYFSLTRSVIEYASVTYHSMLTAELSKKLESLQRMCIRVIYGWERPYEVILQEEKIELLETRRINRCLKFAQECLAHNEFRNWFPVEHEKGHNLRATKRFSMPHFNFKRYDNSPLNFMQRLLNESHAKEHNYEIVSRYSK